MRRTLRTLLVAGLTASLLITGVGTALALDEGTDDAPTFEQVQEKAVERLEGRIDRFETGIGELAGRQGPRAEQLAALFGDGIAIYGQAVADVTEASSVRAIVEIIRDAAAVYREHARVRRLYAHVAGDLIKFERRLGFLEEATDRAEAAGIGVAEAVAEAEAASDDLESSAAALDAVNPAATGPEVLDALAEAHRTAHQAQQHVRAGLAAIGEALPLGEGA